MTRLLYLSDTYLFRQRAWLLNQSQDERGVFVTLDQTIYYPQGGGQPSDQGWLKQGDATVMVTAVRQVQGEIRHYLQAGHETIRAQAPVECELNQVRRILNSRYHTAAHLIGNLVEMLYPSLRAVKGHAFPGEAYVECNGEEDINLDSVQVALAAGIQNNARITIFETNPAEFEQQFYRLPYEVPNNKQFRAIRIGTLTPVPCGGTHLASTGEIGLIKLDKARVQHGKVRISYRLADDVNEADLDAKHVVQSYNTVNF